MAWSGSHLLFLGYYFAILFPGTGKVQWLSNRDLGWVSPTY